MKYNCAVRDGLVGKRSKVMTENNRELDLPQGKNSNVRRKKTLTIKGKFKGILKIATKIKDLGYNSLDKT
eukprot:Awhi_evm1s11556